MIVKFAFIENVNLVKMISANLMYDWRGHAFEYPWVILYN